MIRLFLARVLLTVLAMASFAGFVWVIVDDSYTQQLPFQFDRQGQEYVLHGLAGRPLPAGLADGDSIALREMTVAGRAALFTQEFYRSGSSLSLLIRRGGKVEGVAVPIVAQPLSALGRFGGWGIVVSLSFLLPVALLTLWRGRDATAAWMCVFAVSVLLHTGLLAGITSPLASLWLWPVRQLLHAAYVLAVYGMAQSAARAGLQPAWRKTCFVMVTLLVAMVAAGNLAQGLLPVLLSIPNPLWEGSAATPAVIAAFGIAVLSLLVGYAHAPVEARGRMRWFLASTALLTASVGGQAALQSMNLPELSAFTNLVLLGLALLGYLYAVLRTRIVDVTVVIDRALVYSVATAMVFGLFSLLEDAVHRLALGEQLSWVVQAAGVLGVAAAFSPLHRFLDKCLERVFFHKLRMLAASLRTLGKESAFFENEEALMGRVLSELRVPCASAAIYERSGAVYVRRAAEGEGWPSAFDADDPLFVSLRAGRELLDLKGRKSAAGAEGLAFPMAVGQILTGAIVARLRDGEQLDSEVRAAAAELAQALGTSLYLLRYREMAALTTGISSGQLDPEAARTRAAALAGAL